MTHSALIAGRGSRHFNIEKVVTGKLNRTVVKPLDYQSRVSELARMSAAAKTKRSPVFMPSRFSPRSQESEEGARNLNTCPEKGVA